MGGSCRAETPFVRNSLLLCGLGSSKNTGCLPPEELPGLASRQKPHVALCPALVLPPASAAMQELSMDAEEGLLVDLGPLCVVE